MTPTNVSNYVRGTHVLHPRQLAKLAEALGTTPGVILSANGEMAAGTTPVCLTPVGSTRCFPRIRRGRSMQSRFGRSMVPLRSMSSTRGARSASFYSGK